MIEIPPFKITQGQAATYTMTWTGQDLSAATGSVDFHAKYQDMTSLFTVTPTMDADGLVTISVTAAQSALLPALPRRGFYHVGFFEIVIDGPEDEVFQGELHVASAL